MLNTASKIFSCKTYFDAHTLIIPKHFLLQHFRIPFKLRKFSKENRIIYLLSLFLAECSEIEKRLFLCGRIAQYRDWAPEVF